MGAFHGVAVSDGPSLALRAFVTFAGPPDLLIRPRSGGPFLTPQMTNWLPEDEAAQLKLEFETELKRLAA